MEKVCTNLVAVDLCVLFYSVLGYLCDVEGSSEVLLEFVLVNF